MNKLGVWEVVDLNKEYRLIGTTWVFKIKRKNLNKITEYKAQLCAQGYTQTNGLDYKKTFSLTGGLNSLGTLIANAINKDLEFHQLDIKSTFLNEPLAETVYISIPQGIRLDPTKQFLRLKKALYELKQAPLVWDQMLEEWLTQSGFITCILDSCFFHKDNPSPIWLYMHVDNIAIFGKEGKELKAEISKAFGIKYIGLANLMMGIKINHQD
ncbi:hypothetical protein O181_071292 [Austropuccinia psidii MF-1]|uniref:Reverse transcriptase Ty1/copia-type domain-containing protein n=1 Tax=Austropuccinia psidii MF-1 TaxID=1389203 RepID=A0A9Q3F4W5_9BASI|nr:hypothetical protein [Austropuccinia psidii MF-1]